MREMAKSDAALEWWLEDAIKTHDEDTEKDENYFTPAKISRDPDSTFGLSDASLSNRPRVSPPWGYIELDQPQPVARSIFADVNIGELIDDLVLSVQEPPSSTLELETPRSSETPDVDTATPF